MRRPLAALFVLALLVTPLSAGAQEVNPCATRFPDTVWDAEAVSGRLTLYGAGVIEGQFGRFVDDFGGLAALLEAELGPVDGITACIFPDEIPWDAQAMGWPEGKRLHTATFGEEGLVVVSAYLTRVALDAGRQGVIHAWLWQLSDGNYPEPLADEVKGWYRNRLETTVEHLHTLYVRMNIGLTEPWPPTPWTAGQMRTDLLWNPEFSYGGGGDFANYVAAVSGTGPLANPFGGELEDLDTAWRQSLFDQSGSIPGGSKGWVIGLIGVTAIVSLAVFVAWWSARARRRIEAELREAALRIPKQIDVRAVRPSITDRGGGANAGIRRGSARPVGFDRNDRDRTPSGGKVGTAVDEVPSGAQADDDRFRHPDLGGEG